MAKKAYIGVGGVARKVKKGYIGIHQAPQKQYAMLNYIQSTGTQYITTGTPINESYTVEMKANIQQVTGSLYGLIGNWGTMSCTLYGDEFRFLWYSGCSDWSPTLNTDYVIKHTPSAVYINGSTLSKSSDTNSGSGNFSILNAKSGIGKAKVYYFRVYASDGTTLLADYLPCKRVSDGAIGLYDKVGKRFYINNGTGTFTAGAETGEYIYDVPQEGDYARKIKRAYIGVGGVARPCWSGGELAYYGAVTSLSTGRKALSGRAILGDYAIIAGGIACITVGAATLSTVDMYNTDLTLTSPPPLLYARGGIGGASVTGKYALFGGGYSGGTFYNTVDVYDTSFTRTTTSLSFTGRFDFQGASIGNYALLGSGTVLNAFNENLTRSIPPEPEGIEGNLALAGSYAIAPSPIQSSAYNASLTRTPISAISGGSYRYNVEGVSAESGAVFGGGFSFGEDLVFSNVDVFNDSLTLQSVTPLNTAVRKACGVAIGDFVVFAGGRTSGRTDNISTNLISSTDVYDAEFTRQTGHPLSVPKEAVIGLTIGDYALLAGGAPGDYASLTDAVEAFTIV